MNFISSIIRLIGLPAVIIIGLLAYYEGVPFLRDIPFIDHIPVVRELITGRVASEAAKAADKAREGYVLQAQAIAAQAEADKLKRDLAVAQIVIDSYEAVAKSDLAKEEAEAAAAEQGIPQNEQKLKAAGKSRLLDQSDIDWLRQSQ